jgi:hypothetical protein
VTEPKTSADVADVFVQWEKVLGDLLDRTMKFPKAVRHSLVERIDGYALDVATWLVEARYTRGARKRAALVEADLALTKVRILLRVAYDRRHLDPNGFEHLCRALDEVGRQLGGWLKSTSADP